MMDGKSAINSERTSITVPCCCGMSLQSCTGEVDDLLDQFVKAHGRDRQLRFALAVEILHPRDRMCDISHGALNGLDGIPLHER